MSQNKEDNTFTLTVPVRMIFVNLLAPRAFKQGSEPKYSATFLIPNESPDLEGIKSMIGRVFREAFPSADMTGRVPLKLGDREADKAKAKGKDLEVARGHWVLGSSSGYRPVLSVSANGSVVDLTTEDLIAKYGAQFYAGAEAYAAFYFAKYAITELNYGVTAYLQNVYSLNRGAKIGASSGASRFNHVTGHVTSTNPTEPAWT